MTIHNATTNITSGFCCDRTCPLFEVVDLCRFQPVMRRIGRVVVNSHTMKVDVEFRDRDAFGRAAERMGGEAIGPGRHELFERDDESGEIAAHDGYGIRLPDWSFPLILSDDGQLLFDDYEGAWGNVADIETLKSHYAVEVARSAAEAQGWYCEDAADGSVVVYHPQGGTLTVTADGTVDANGFTGTGCHNPTDLISQAMGTVTDVTAKPAYYAAQAEIRVQEQ